MEILSTDQLMHLNENDLKQLILSLRSMIKESELRDSDLTDRLKAMQIYYCHVFRELEHRGIV